MQDEKTVTLGDPITNETKEVPLVLIDWFMISKAIKKVKKWLLSIITGENNFIRRNIFHVTNSFPLRKPFPPENFPRWRFSRYVNRILNMPRVLNIPKFWIWQSSEYGSVLNMRASHSVLNIPEYALIEFWMHLRF